VRLGISPFGIPSPETPDFVKGAPYLDQYEVTYADPALWLRNGWCDYMMPELYWKTGAPNQPFPALLDWWADPKSNPKERNIYSGLFTSAVNQFSTSWSPDEITGQIMITRSTPGASGHGHFSMRALNQNRKGLADLLQQGPYSQGALPPKSPWLGKNAPAAPSGVRAERISPPDARAMSGKRIIQTPWASPSRLTGPTTRPFATLRPPTTQKAAKEQALGGVKLSWDAPKSSAVWRWAIYSKHGDRWHYQLVGRGESKNDEPVVALVPDDLDDGPATVIAVSAIDHVGNESARVTADLTKAK
jgi:Glycosyl hydrolase-like 10